MKLSPKLAVLPAAALLAVSLAGCGQLLNSLQSGGVIHLKTCSTLNDGKLHCVTNDISMGQAQGSNEPAQVQNAQPGATVTVTASALPSASVPATTPSATPTVWTPSATPTVTVTYTQPPQPQQAVITDPIPQPQFDSSLHRCKQSSGVNTLLSFYVQDSRAQSFFACMQMPPDQANYFIALVVQAAYDAITGQPFNAGQYGQTGNDAEQTVNTVSS